MTTSDFRQTDVDEAEAIMAMVDAEGGAPLPQLTDTDLCVFSDAFATLLDKDVWTTWLALPDPERIRRAELAQGFLAERRLLRLVEDGCAPEVAIQPKLGYILAARQRPSFVAVCSVPGTAQPSAPHLFGLSDQSRSEQCLLAEQVTPRTVPVLGRIREYGLFLPRRAGNFVAGWAAGTLRLPGGGNESVVVDLYDHATQAQDDGPTVERMTIRHSAADGTLRVEHVRPGGGYTQRGRLDQDALADQLALLFNRTLTR
ncbi:MULTISPECIES: hypothetical protein [Streptacidiphilus]|uniref:ESX secretion-associated protein EspG n=1 Tax=Streptacidiphilus cavernicola TaxID=3342716 RepID=A0ABV6UVA0_9ACTN|nr:hypothetical protein [Streptacidiphilus jeojiense]